MPTPVVGVIQIDRDKLSMIVVVFVVFYLVIAGFIMDFPYKQLNAIKSNLTRVMAKSAVISLLFAPTIISEYIVAFPAPFPVTLAFYIEKAVKNGGDSVALQALYLCLTPCLIFFALCVFVGIAVPFLLRKFPNL